MASVPNRGLNYRNYPNSLALVFIVIAAAFASSDARIIKMIPDPDVPGQYLELSPNAISEELTEIILPRMSTPPPPFDYTPYLNKVLIPLAENELENSLDLNDRTLMSEFNFDPTHILKLLIDRAAADKTTPDKFYEEMQDLVNLQDRLKTELENVESHLPVEEPLETLDDVELSTTEATTEVSTTETPTTEETTLIAVNTNTDSTDSIMLKQLQKKYNISSKSVGPDSITAFRLNLMFPHYLNLGQKPFVASSSVDIDRDASFFTTTTEATPEYYMDQYGNQQFGIDPMKVTPTPSSRTVQIPTFFKRPEFGGLIPRNGSMDDRIRKAIIAIHLYNLVHDNGSEAIPFRAQCALLKWRMERSLMSDDRRVRFLLNNDLVSSDGIETSEFLKYDALISTEFYNKIFWNVLN